MIFVPTQIFSNSVNVLSNRHLQFAADKYSMPPYSDPIQVAGTYSLTWNTNYPVTYSCLGIVLWHSLDLGTLDLRSRHTAKEYLVPSLAEYISKVSEGLGDISRQTDKEQ